MQLSLNQVLVGVILSTGSVSIGWAFWSQDMRYALPTPRPAHLRQPTLGARLALPLSSDPRPTFLAFYNPTCPCSRFNLDHLHELQAAFGDRVRFVAITTEGEAPGIQSVADEKGRISKLCGVYSTPQAVLLDAGGSLYFRGNFNRSRYCREPRSEYARLALDALMRGQKPPAFPQTATVAYGCALPE